MTSREVLKRLQAMTPKNVPGITFVCQCCNKLYAGGRYGYGTGEALLLYCPMCWPLVLEVIEQAIEKEEMP